jgi:hypothetical protein
MATLEDKIAQLPQVAQKEITDFIEFLFWKYLEEPADSSDGDFSDYLRNLEDYEERLANGEVQW